MQVRTPPGHPGVSIENQLVPVRHDPQQLGRDRALPAPDARAYRLPATSTLQHYSARPGSALTGAGAVSDRMSMRHPVSRAASRAFWPSRPIARDNL